MLTCEFPIVMKHFSLLLTWLIDFPLPFYNISLFLNSFFYAKPDYNFLKTFVYRCYTCLRLFNPYKLQPRSSPCIHIGYNLSHKGYKCLTHYEKIILSRRFIFDENTFSFLCKMDPNQFVKSTFCMSVLPILTKVDIAQL